VSVDSLITARLIKRLNRFAALVEVEGKEEMAHIPNSGRMKDLLYPDARVIIKKAGGKGRKTPYDLLFAFHGEYTVSIDSRLPNYLLEEAIKKGKIPELSGYQQINREASWGTSRFDLILRGKDRKDCLIEIKSVNLVREGVALFPDAPTTRGRRHLEELGEAYQKGFRAVTFFLIMREDAVVFSPHDEMDPPFGRALRESLSRGMEIMVRSCRFSGYRVEVGDSLPYYLKELEAP